MAGFRQQVELVDLLVPEKDPAHVPFDALADDPICASQPVENFQRALGPADRARTDADGVVFVEHHHVDAALREIDRRAKTDRAGAGDDSPANDAAWRSARSARAHGIDRVGVASSLSSHCELALKRLPHRLVALRGPDARVAILCRFVVRRESRRTAGNGRK